MYIFFLVRFTIMKSNFKIVYFLQTLHGCNVCVMFVDSEIF